MTLSKTMARNDPTNTGGLFIGRRPGTAPLRYREQPGRRRASAGAARRRARRRHPGRWRRWSARRSGARSRPAWLWVGSQVDYETGNVGLGILVAFAGMLATIIGTLAIAMRLDRAWKLVRRAGGHEQKDGMLERIFVISMAIAGIAFMIWFLVIQGPGSGPRAAVGAAGTLRGTARLLPPVRRHRTSEFNETLRERRAREKALALEHVPHARPVGHRVAGVAQRRGRERVGLPGPGAPQRLSGPPRDQVRRALAERHNIEAARSSSATGPRSCFRRAAYLLPRDGDEVVVPWPSYPLYPSIALRAGARPVVEPGATTGPDRTRCCAAVSDRTRVLVLCNPNDPTGTYVAVRAARRAAVARCPTTSTCCSTRVRPVSGRRGRGCVHEARGGVSAPARLPHVLARLRPVGPASRLRRRLAGATALLASLAPALGVNALTQAAVLQALRVGDATSSAQRRP